MTIMKFLFQLGMMNAGGILFIVAILQLLSGLTVFALLAAIVAAYAAVIAGLRAWEQVRRR